MKPPANLPGVYLKPGELIFAKNPTLVTTVLGSCISITMINHKLKIGAIIHAMLPYYKNSGDAKNKKDPFNYVDRSIEFILSEFEKNGVKIKDIEAKLFGGANMFAGSNQKNGTIGYQNSKVAIEIMKQSGIEPVKIDVGGTQSRKIIFNTASGEVWLKRINRENSNLNQI